MRSPLCSKAESGQSAADQKLESFDWSFNPQIPKALILDLGTVRFIPEHGGLLLLGPPGTGKSHIALSLTVAAIQAGYTALYRSAFDLAQDLAEAEATGTRPEFIRKLTRGCAGDRGPGHAPPAIHGGGGPAGDLHPPL
jgi:DNA replication protein DnaC